MVMNLKFTKKIKVHFRKLGTSLYGLQCDHDIWVDLSKNTNPARTFLHELLHFKYPEKSERAIKHLEKRIWDNMSQKERYNLFRCLFSKKWDSTPMSKF